MDQSHRELCRGLRRHKFPNALTLHKHRQSTLQQPGGKLMSEKQVLVSGADSAPGAGIHEKANGR